MKVIKSLNKPGILIVILFLSHLLFSYYALGGWWHSSIGTVLILYLSFILWGKSFLKTTGLKISRAAIFFSLALTIILIILFYLIILYIASKNEITVSFTNIFNYYHIFFYTLNEEIILGAIVINLSIAKLKMKPIVVSILLALIFSSIHFVFYKWVFLERGTIAITTLAALFMVGIIRNNLIIKTGHIGFSWALHFSWMLIMFGLIHSQLTTGENLMEFERFNLYLGSTEILIISSIFALISSLFIFKQKSIKQSSLLV